LLKRDSDRMAGARTFELQRATTGQTAFPEQTRLEKCIGDLA
jgi:hypothetical protein